MKFKFILSDLDGVIRIYPPERVGAIEKKFGLPSGSILAAAFEKSLLQQAVCGVISDEEWRSAISKALATICDANVAQAAVEEWSDFSGVIDRRYLNHLQSRFCGIPVAVLTNGTSRLLRDLAILGIESQFFRIFNSAQIGICKPDIKVYAHVIQNLGCKPSEILFIDDSLSHVEAARGLGLVTHHYRSFENFENFSFVNGKN